MTQARRMTVGLVAGTLALTAAGCGGSGKHTAASTTASQPAVASTVPTSPTDTTTTDTRVTATPGNGKQSRTHKHRTATGTAGTSPPLSQTPAKVLRYAGRGVLELGTVRIPKDSTITWTNDGQLFQIIPASARVKSPVNSFAHSGTAQIKKGAYHGFLVNAVGSWKVTITPN